jgi:hypothetical protein
VRRRDSRQDGEPDWDAILFQFFCVKVGRRWWRACVAI